MHGITINLHLSFFFLGSSDHKYFISKNIIFNIIRPNFSSKNLRFLGIDADSTDLFPISPKLVVKLKNFDLIHTTDQLHSMAKSGKFASKVWNIPLTTSFHTDTPSYTEYYVLGMLKKLPLFLENFLKNKFYLHKRVSGAKKKKIINYINGCRFAFVNDNFSKKQINFFKDCNSKVGFMKRGIDNSIFTVKKVDKNHFLKKFKINPNHIILFFCGRIHRLKGVILLSKINKLLNEKGFKVTTVMAGENIHGEECKKIYSKNLVILNYLDQKEISKFYNICDFFVFPSLYETGPQVVLEARSCGAICIVSNSGGGKRIKVNGEDGLKLGSQSPDLWSKEIIKLLKSRKQFLFMKKKVLESNKYLSWEEVFNDIFYKKWKLII